MNKAEKFRKLGNAIRAFHGITTSPEGAEKREWLTTPQPDKLKRIRELLALLRLDGEEQDYAIEEIKAFKTVAQFKNWIKQKQDG